MKKGLKSAFIKAQKTVDLQEGLNMNHFIKISNGVLNPKRTIGEALMSKLKLTAAKQGKSNLISDINKAQARKRRQEMKNQTR